MFIQPDPVSCAKLTAIIRRDGLGALARAAEVSTGAASRAAAGARCQSSTLRVLVDAADRLSTPEAPRPAA